MDERLRKRPLLPSVISVERMVAILTEARGAVLRPRFSSKSVSTIVFDMILLADNGRRPMSLTEALAGFRDYENSPTAA